MKRSEIENELKREAETHTPDVYSRVLASAREEGIMSGDPADFAAKSAPRRSRNKRAVFAAAGSVAACFAIALPVAFYGFGGSGGGGVYSVALSAQEAYGMGAVTTAKLLCSEVLSGAVSSLSAVKLLGAESSSAELQIPKFNEYFALFEICLGEGGLTTNEAENDDPAYAGYERKITVSGIGLNGNNESYVMYYNETLRRAIEKDGETKAEYVLEGVMALDGVDYALRGERSFEDERDETENELKIRAYPDVADETTYVQMEQETSVEKGKTECEYVYSVVRSGKLIEETSVEFESEKKGGKEEIKMELEFRSGKAKGKYELKRETKNGASQMKAKYEIDGEKGEFVIVPEGGGFEYVFPNGIKFSFGKK